MQREFFYAWADVNRVLVSGGARPEPKCQASGHHCYHLTRRGEWVKVKNTGRGFELEFYSACPCGR